MADFYDVKTCNPRESLGYLVALVRRRLHRAHRRRLRQPGRPDDARDAHRSRATPAQRSLAAARLSMMGFVVFAAVAFWRGTFNTGADFATIAMPQLLQGVGVAFFFTPLISINLGGIPVARIANATGLQNFMRMMAGSFGASIVISVWDNRQDLHRSRLSESLSLFDTTTRHVVDTMQGLGMTPDQAYGQLERMLISQSYMLATNDIFWIVGVLFLALIPLLWTTRPPFSAGPGGGH